jgi:heptosyltransferase-2
LALGEGSGPPRPQIANLIGRTDLPTLAGVMARCGAFVSNDSGAMHLAAAVGVPVTAIFGPTREWATSPLGPGRVLKADVFCRPCMLRECPIDHRCMKRVTPETVLAAVEEQVGRNRRSAPG